MSKYVTFAYLFYFNYHIACCADDMMFVFDTLFNMKFYEISAIDMDLCFILDFFVKGCRMLSIS